MMSVTPEGSNILGPLATISHLPTLMIDCLGHISQPYR